MSASQNTEGTDPRYAEKLGSIRSSFEEIVKVANRIRLPLEALDVPRIDHAHQGFWEERLERDRVVTELRKEENHISDRLAKESWRSCARSTYVTSGSWTEQLKFELEWTTFDKMSEDTKSMITTAIQDLGTLVAKIKALNRTLLDGMPFETNAQMVREALMSQLETKTANLKQVSEGVHTTTSVVKVGMCDAHTGLKEIERNFSRLFRSLHRLTTAVGDLSVQLEHTGALLFANQTRKEEGDRDMSQDQSEIVP